MKPDLLKRTGYIVFSISFILAMRIFGQVGASILTRETAIWLFMLFGAFGFVLNLINQRKIEKQRHYHLLFWIGCSVTLIGFGMKLLQLNYHWWVIVLGMTTVFSSFFFHGKEEKESNDELLDN
jgi:hypothetical protein